MSAIALPLTNILAGLAGIGAGVGFGIAEEEKMKELNKESETLNNSATSAGDLYDHTYYLVSVNIDRVKKSIDALPSDFLSQVQSDIDALLTGGDGRKAVAVLGQVLGYGGEGLGVLSGIITAVRKIQAKRQAAGEPEPTLEPEDNPYIELPGGDQPPPPESIPETLPETTWSQKIQKGIDVGGLVFAIGGLAVTVGLGVWTLEKLNEALDEVKKKQVEVTNFQDAMTTVLNELLASAELPAKSYDQLQTMAGIWKEISQHYEGYSKQMKYAIKGYFQGKSLEDVKTSVEGHADEGLQPFPDDAYALAKTLADDIRVQFEANKTDKQVVDFFATDNPNIGLRFVFDEFFISDLRDLMPSTRK